MLHHLGPPQYTTEEPVYLENNDDNYEEVSLALKNFDASTYYKIAPEHIKKCIKNINRKIMKKNFFSISGIVKSIVI